MKIYVTDIAEPAATYKEAIRFSGGVMVSNNRVEPAYVDACINREVDYPTGLSLPSGHNVAMPHGNSDLVKADTISLVRLQRGGAEFGRMDDKSVRIKSDLVFNLALTTGQKHINILRQLMMVFQDEDVIDFLYQVSAEDAKTKLTSIFAD